MAEQELDRNEEATPFKLRRAREKGQVARGQDLGFVGSLIALTVFVLWFGGQFVQRLTELMRLTFTSGIERVGQDGDVLGVIGGTYWDVFEPLVVLGGIVIVVLVVLELIQLRGFIFTTAPLKPDFKRLNPVQGLKRLFSMRMLKEFIKNLIKMAVYTVLAWLMITGAMSTFGDTFGDAHALVRAMEGGARRLLFAFILTAVVFMLIDQVITRGEFAKQMRMSTRELKREVKDREGEPRFRQKRRQIHAEMRKQTEGLANVQGSDFLIVNPDHYAVALRYIPDQMKAPEIRARGRNHIALALKRRARLLGVPIIADPQLAQALYREGRQDRPIPTDHYHAVARHYSQKQKRDRARMAAGTFDE
jgi:flagellar biosynthesis protein FlhB